MARLRRRDNPTGNVAVILFGALMFGLAAGFPMGYFAHLYAAANNPDLALVQNK